MIIKTTDYFKFASARHRRDGMHSGEAFREDVILPALETHGTISIDLCGDYGFPASWIEECFGGLVRGGMLPEDVLKRVNILSNDSLLVKEAIHYIKTSGSTHD